MTAVVPSRVRQPPVRLLVMAKEPVPGRVKTRLAGRYGTDGAALLAAAALADTLAAALVLPPRLVRPVLVLDGRAGEWVPPGLPVVPQRGTGLAERLSAAFDDASSGEPALLIGMDTPQVTPRLLTVACRRLRRTDAVLGPAADGGWWALGLANPLPRLLDGVPMSSPSTGLATRQRLAERGLTVRALPRLRDVDTPPDAHAVAALAPGTRFARTLHRLDRLSGSIEPDSPPRRIAGVSHSS